MEDTQDIRNRTFSFGAHGYNQDDVDRYLHELADRIDGGDVDWEAEIERFRRRSFAVVSLGYWRPDVDSYMAELGERMSERAAAARMQHPGEDAPDESAAVDVTGAEGVPAAMPAGWAQGIVERLRRVTETSTAPTALAGVGEGEVPDVVAAAPLRLEDRVEGGGGEVEAPGPLDREADRARLFRMAITLGVPDAVSMTAAELVAAIDRARGGEEPSGAEAAGQPGEDENAALLRTKATLASFERMLADQVSQVTAASRHERDAAAREAEEIVREAERRAGEIVAAAEQEGDALGERARRYSERVRRLADRDALRRAAAAEQPPVAVVEPEPMPEPDRMPEPEPEPMSEPEQPAEPEAEAAAESESEPDTPPADEETAGDTQQAPASTWARLRRMLG